MQYFFTIGKLQCSRPSLKFVVCFIFLNHIAKLQKNYKLLAKCFERIESGLISNHSELAIIKIWIIYSLKCRVFCRNQRGVEAMARRMAAVSGVGEVQG